MSVGKRLSTSDPLTEHDIAERLNRALLRVLQIMYDVRINYPELLEPVRSSRYLSNVPSAVAAELQAWGIEPQPLKESP